MSAFNDWWVSLKKPLGGNRKGYKKGALAGWLAHEETVPKLTNHLEASVDIQKLLINQIQSLKQDKAKLLECVAFYADMNNWYQNNENMRRLVIFQGDSENMFFTRCESNYFGGKRARQCLKDLGEE